MIPLGLADEARATNVDTVLMVVVYLDSEAFKVTAAVEASLQDHFIEALGLLQQFSFRPSRYFSPVNREEFFLKKGGQD